MLKTIALAVPALLLAASMNGQEPVELRTVPRVDLTRYAGDWYEVARLPNRFQNRCVGDVRASYALRDDGRIDVVNRCRTRDGAIDAHGLARVVDEQSFARLKVRFAPAVLSFLPMVWGDYWVIGLADDYSWAVVGSPDRKYLWILSRQPMLDAATFDRAAGIARENGFDVSRLLKTTHAKLRNSARRAAPMVARLGGRDSLSPTQMLTLPMSATRTHDVSSCAALVCARVITIGTTITTTTGTTTSGAVTG